MDKREEKDIIQEPYEAVFYFQKSEMLYELWKDSAFISLMLLGTCLVSIFLIRQAASPAGLGICIFFTGMLLNIPVEIAENLWKSSRCLEQITFDGEKIIVNCRKSVQETFYKSDIKKIEQKAAYLKMETRSGRKRSYWLGKENSMPMFVKKRFIFEIGKLHT